MVAWRNNHGMQVLIGQLDELSPGCEIGTIGDASHVSNNPSSDHNPKRLNGSNVVNACDPMVRTSEYPRRLTAAQINDVINNIIASRDSRIKYIIWQRRIISGNDGPQAWVWRTYTGTNDPHINHAHISVEDIADTNTREWSIDDMPTSQEIAKAVWERKPWNSDVPISAADAIQQASRADNLLTEMRDMLDTRLSAIERRLDAIEGSA